MNNIYFKLSKYIKAMDIAGRLLLYKDNEELSFLKEWIKSGSFTNEGGNSSFERSPDNEETLPDVIKNCKKCRNVGQKKQGWGTGRNGLLIIMNTPVNISRMEREEITDPSKELLKKMIKAINIDLNECYITNLIKCEAENSVERPGSMLKNCMPILIREIQEFDPSIIIIMGDSLPVKKIINEYSSRKWFQIEHPVSLIKNRELKRSAWATLQKVMKELKNPREKIGQDNQEKIQ
jgi:uracil-DNA glycosylase family 4